MLATPHISTGANRASSFEVHQRDEAAKSLIPKFGVALFDNPRDMSAGWACRADESPFKFNSVSELSNDTMWVTSLAWEEYNYRAKKLNHLRRIDYLRTSLTAIAADLGRRLVGAYAMDSSAVLAKVLNQSMLIAIHTYRWDSPTSDLREDVLAKDILRILPPAPKPQQHTRAALMSAYQAYSTPDWAPMYEPDTITLTMRYNRLDYAQQITNTLVPDDAWTYVPPEQACRMNIDELLNPERPSLVEAVVELGDINPDISTLIAFGAGTTRRAGLRKWISQPELAWLSRHCKVRVSSALLSQGARPLPPGVVLPARLTSDPLFSLTISAGLVAEAHWTAIVSPVYNRALRNEDVSSWAVWLRAIDRSLSFSLALKAFEAGFRVTGYGNGSIVLKTTRSNLRACLKFADENNIAHPAFHQIFTEHGIANE